MHIGLEYGIQHLPENLSESQSAEGFVNPNGQFNNKSKRKIYVYENEGRVPHCHYVDSATGREICVRLDKPEYFTHGGKQTKFTSKEKETFIAFMQWNNSLGVNTWAWCVSTWNGFAEEDDSNMEKITIKNIPDYSKLK